MDVTSIGIRLVGTLHCTTCILYVQCTCCLFDIAFFLPKHVHSTFACVHPVLCSVLYTCTCHNTPVFYYTLYMYMYNVHVATYMCMLQGTEHLPQISRESGVNIVAGTSYYFDKFISPDDKMLSVQEVHVLYMLHSSMYMYSHYTSSAVQTSSL